MILFAQVPDEDVQRDVVLREARRHFDGEEDVGQLGDAKPPSRVLWSVIVTWVMPR